MYPRQIFGISPGIGDDDFGAGQGLAFKITRLESTGQYFPFI